MATTYTYELNDGNLKILVVDELGPLNTWSSAPTPNCLVIDSGAVDAEPFGQILKAGVSPYSPVLTLKGASWDSEVGDEGDVEAHLVDGCNPTRWVLRNVD